MRCSPRATSPTRSRFLVLNGDNYYPVAALSRARGGSTGRASPPSASQRWCARATSMPNACAHSRSSPSNATGVVRDIVEKPGLRHDARPRSAREHEPLAVRSPDLRRVPGNPPVRARRGRIAQCGAIRGQRSARPVQRWRSKRACSTCRAASDIPEVERRLRHVEPSPYVTASGSFPAVSKCLGSTRTTRGAEPARARSNGLHRHNIVDALRGPTSSSVNGAARGVDPRGPCLDRRREQSGRSGPGHYVMTVIRRFARDFPHACRSGVIELDTTCRKPPA